MTGLRPEWLKFAARIAQWIGVALALASPGIAQNNASVVSMSAPDSVLPGQRFTATVVMHNNGTTTWSPDLMYRLGSVNDALWRPDTRIHRIGKVFPNQDASYTFSCVAPISTGSKLFGWRMVQELTEWFGATASKQITVALTYGSASGVVYLTAPDIVRTGETFTATVQMVNQGTTTWTTTRHALGALNDNTIWGPNTRIPLPVNTSGGQTATFVFTVQAPPTPGTLPFSWRLVRDGTAWFGATASKDIVVVQSPSPVPDNTFRIYGKPKPRTPVMTDSEYQARRMVRDYYEIFLSRLPTADEMTTKSNDLLNGVTDSQALMKWLYRSAEYGQLHQVASLSNPKFVKMAYQVVLDRTPAASEVNYWVNVIEQSGWSRDQVFDSFIDSEESRIRNGRSSRNGGQFLNSGDEGAMGSLWRGESAFEKRQEITWNGFFDISGRILVRNGVWYLFNREHDFPGAQPDPPCSGGWVFRYSVQTSTDQGLSWSGKTPIVTPGAIPSPDACGVADGDVLFDGSAWHFMGQCMDPVVRNWQMCHYKRQAADPMGPFTLDAVLPTGSLWTMLMAAKPGDYAEFTNMGTPQLLQKQGEPNQFYVLYHGYRGPFSPTSPTPLGFTGLAKTSDFLTYQVVDPDNPDSLPASPVLSKGDCLSAFADDDLYPDPPEGCVGQGFPAVLRDGNYYYLLVETPTRDLAANGQYWPYLLYRSPRLSKTRAWELFWGGPIVEGKDWSFQELLVYATLVKDGPDVFLSFWDRAYSQKSNHYLFRLTVKPSWPPDADTAWRVDNP